MARFAESRNFANELRRAIDDHFEGNMTSFAKKAKVPLGTVAHYCRPGDAGRYPSSKQLEAILVAMPKEAKLGLVRAFIRDLVPQRLAGDFDVVSAGGKVAPVKVAQGVKLPESTLEALEFLAALAAENQSARRMIEATAKAMKGS